MKKIVTLVFTLLLCAIIQQPVMASEKSQSITEDAAAQSSVTFAFPEGATVTTPAVILVSFDEPERQDAAAFATGSSREELSEWFSWIVSGFTGYDADGNPHYLTSSSWLLDSIDTSVPGLYQASAAPELGSEYAVAEGVILPLQLSAVSIQDPGKPDINCIISGRGFLHFPWVISEEQQEQLGDFSVWLKHSEGEWIQLSDGFSFTSWDFQLSQKILENGSTYSLQIEYPGGQTGILTFEYDAELGILDYSTGDRDGGDAEGSGSGSVVQPAPIPPQIPQVPDDTDSPPPHSDKPESDKSENDKPRKDTSDDITVKIDDIPEVKPEDLKDSHLEIALYPGTDPLSQKTAALTLPDALSEAESFTAPDIKSESPDRSIPHKKSSEPQKTYKPEKTYASDKPASVLELSTPEKTVISGLRLRDLCEDEENIVFGSGDIKASIPAELLLALEITDLQTLSVELIRKDEYQILFAVKSADSYVTDLSGTVLSLRYQPVSENAEISVQDKYGETVSGSSYDGEFLKFEADSSGTYTVIELPHAEELLSAEEASHKPSLMIPVLSGLIVIAGGLGFLRRKRRG